MGLGSGFGEPDHRVYGRRGLRRRFVPRCGLVRYAGKPICYDMKWSDRIVPKSWLPDAALDQPDYEPAPLVKGLIETVQPSEKVTMVGAGLGATVVIVAISTAAYSVP